MGQFEAAVRGIADACRALETPGRLRERLPLQRDRRPRDPADADRRHGRASSRTSHGRVPHAFARRGRRRRAPRRDARRARRERVPRDRSAAATRGRAPRWTSLAEPRLVDLLVDLAERRPPLLGARRLRRRPRRRARRGAIPNGLGADLNVETALLPDASTSSRSPRPAPSSPSLRGTRRRSSRRRGGTASRRPSSGA